MSAFDYFHIIAAPIISWFIIVFVLYHAVVRKFYDKADSLISLLYGIWFAALYAWLITVSPVRDSLLLGSVGFIITSSVFGLILIVIVVAFATRKK